MHPTMRGIGRDTNSSLQSSNGRIEELTTRTIKAADFMRAHPNHIIKKYSSSNLLIVPLHADLRSGNIYFLVLLPLLPTNKLQQQISSSPPPLTQAPAAAVCLQSCLQRDTFQAAKVRWPYLFHGVDSATQDWIVDQMHSVRPVVETGYENVLLVRLLLETRIPSIRKSSVAEGLTVEGILENWSKLKPVIMEEWSENRETLIDLFGKVRDEWLEQDFATWIGRWLKNFQEKPIWKLHHEFSARFRSVPRRNAWSGLIPSRWLKNFQEKPIWKLHHEFSARFRSVPRRNAWSGLIPSEYTFMVEYDSSLNYDCRFYPGVSDALKFASSRVYIVTTKQSRFADALLRELAGVTIPPERIYGLGTGPKVEVLKQLQKRLEHQGLTLHFVEDRLATLKNVIKEPELDQWNLYLGNWGYNTQKEREEAAAIPRIQVLELSDFSKKLK
ncbi:hypothetical protein Ahy_B04g072143 [Arachis hypogaea]|uniref:Uncharacterized protein n=1 Tax=Arachis hypogaea TaxID=3818 RepID=A0A444ZMH6_ARAHY|nr:hypothetical protein Ahy_B04g072143 [Arachis hypogaea]